MSWRIALIWACTAARLMFYCAALPLWDGFDEWAHFGVVRAAADGSALPPRALRISSDVEETLRTAPLPWTERQLPPPSVTHDDFWRLPVEERVRRLAAFRAIPKSWARIQGDLPAYETQQPPLYYWLMAPAMAAMRGWSIADQVLALRWIGALLASCVIPLAYAIGLRVFENEGLALAAAAIVGLMPGFAIAVARVGNDGLAALLYAVLILLGLQWIQERRGAFWIGIVLGLGLLTKAYFLTAIPAVAALFWFWRGRWYGAGAGAIGAWWYVRNLLVSGSLSGLQESAMAASGFGSWRHIADISWPRAIDSALFAHIYTGGWSMLTVRSWMYHVFYAAAVIAAVALIRVRRKPGIRWLLAVYAAFWAGALYDILLLFVTRGVATSMGYYLYAVVAAEIPLAIAGLRKWAAYVFASLFAALDLYTVHAVEIPYYAGMIRHKAGNALAAVHWRDFSGIGFASTWGRLTMFRGDFVGPTGLAALWGTYLAATILLTVCALYWVGRHPDSRVLNSENGKKAATD